MSNEGSQGYCVPVPAAPTIVLMANAQTSQNLTHRIVQDLGIAVVSGQYSKDNPFPVEADLCRQYGASRSVLREAVKMLTAKGLLRARPRQGTWVQPEENWNLLDPDSFCAGSCNANRGCSC